MAAPSAAMNVRRGTPSSSAQTDQIRVSSIRVSPTSSTTQRCSPSELVAYASLTPATSAWTDAFASPKSMAVCGSE